MDTHARVAAVFAEMAMAYPKERARKPPSAGTVFIRGNTIYSWGTHWPIARIVGKGKVLINRGKISPTTSRHTGIVNAACLKAGAKMYPCDLGALDSGKKNASKMEHLPAAL